MAELKVAAQPLQLSHPGLDTSQHQLAADQLAPTAACLTVSRTGRWAAVTSSSRVHVFDLEALSYHGRLPALQARLTSSALLAARPILPHLLLL